MPDGTNPNTLTADDYSALLKALDTTALVSITDKRGIIIYANQIFVDVSRYELGELIGQNHRILKSGDQSDDLFVDLWKTISSGKIWRGEIKNRAKDGTYYWVDTSIAPILDENKKPIRYISVRFLITDKKEAEELQQEKTAELEALNKVMIDRELKMVELKEKVAELKSELKAA